MFFNEDDRILMYPVDRKNIPIIAIAESYNFQLIHLIHTHFFIC